MKWQQFKNRLKKDAQQQEADVDLDALWNALEPQVDELNKQPRKRRFIFWLFFTGVLIAGTGWFFLLENNSRVEVAYDEGISVEKIAENELIVKRENPSITTAAQNKNQAALSTATPDPNDGSNAIANVPAETKQVIETTPKNITTSSITTPLPFQKTTFSKTPRLSITKNKTASTVTNKTHNALEDTKSATPVSKEIEKTKTLVTSKALLPLPKQQSLLTSEESLLLLSKNYLPSALKEYSAEKTSANKKAKSSIQFSVEVLGGISYVNRSLKAKNIAADELLNIRDKYETNLEASHYGVALGLQHTAGFRFSLGLQSTSIAERYQWAETLSEVDSILGVQVLRINLDGDTIPIMGMIPQTTTTEGVKDIYNTYRLIDIPIRIAYQRSFGKWNAGLELGVLANISLKTAGIIPDEKLEDVDIKTQQSSLFKSKIGLSYQIGLVVSRSISDHFELSFSPTVRFIPKDFSVSEYGLSQKYSLIGGNIGLHYRF